MIFVILALNQSNYTPKNTVLFIEFKNILATIFLLKQFNLKSMKNCQFVTLNLLQPTAMPEWAHSFSASQRQSFIRSLAQRVLNSHFTLCQRSFNSQKNSANPNSIKNHTQWMSRFEFQNKFCNLSLVLGDRLDLALLRKSGDITHSYVFRRDSGYFCGVARISSI